MSSAAKLRKYGRGTATIAAAALVMTSFGPAAFASWDDDPTTNTVEAWPEANSTVFTGLHNYGTIGIADTGAPVVPVDGDTGVLTPTPAPQSTETADENQGATLVWAGKDDQRVADVRLTLPNRFKAGDIIDLVLTDRSSTETQSGNTNADAGRSVGFSGDPTIDVDAAPKVGNKEGNGWAVDTQATPTDQTDDIVYPAGTQVSADSDAVTDPATNREKVSNTETGAANWVAHRDSAPLSGDSAADSARKAVQRTKPGVAPKFDVQVTPDSGNLGKNRIRLVVKDTAATGDPDAMWVMTVKDLKVNLGSNVTPGELRVTPFATGFDANNNSMPSPWFANNHKEGVGSAIPTGARGAGNTREIGIYTVPAYVSPVTISGDNLSIIADQTPQNVGPVTVAETQPYSLGNGTYYFRVNGAIPESTDASKVKIEVQGGGTSEVATVSTVAASSGTDTVVTFTLSGADNTKASKFVISGLLLKTPSSSSTSLSFGLSGGTINGVKNADGSYPGGDYWLTPAGTSTLSIPATPTAAAIHPDSWFVGESGVAESNRAAAATAPALAAGTNSVSFSNTTANFTLSQTGTPTGASTFTAATAAQIVVTRDATAGPNQWDVTTVTVQGQTFTLATGGIGGAAGTATRTDAGVTYTLSFPAASTTPQQGAVDIALTAMSGPSGVITAPSTNVADSVNQTDILAHGAISQLMLQGVAASPVARIGGNNRYETAAKIAEAWTNGDKSLVNGKFKNAIIASGENFPDALSAAYLSQRMAAPILLVQKNSIPADTIEALRDRQVEKVFIVGGPAAVSNEVADKLRSLDTYWYDSNADDNALKTTGAKLQAQRLSSANPQNDNRYTTNQLVNMYAAAWGGTSTIGRTVYKYGESRKYTAIFARGDNFPDALAAGVLTAGLTPQSGSATSISANALPLVLTQPGELSSSAKAQIENLDVQHALIIGSENAVSDGVKKSIEDMGVTNTRIGGADRYFTAAAVDEFAMRDSIGSPTNEYPGLGFLGQVQSDGTFLRDVNSYLATGLKFPDALTASPWIGRNANALNLVWQNDLTDGTRNFLTKRAQDVNRAIGLGLGDAVSTKIVGEANAIAATK